MTWPTLFSMIACLQAPAMAFPTNGGRHEICVKSGQSIQAAIDSATTGDKIIVGAGTYTEQLLITKDGITLVGEAGARIVPPVQYAHNSCTGIAGEGTNVGICIAGTGLQLAPFVSEHQKVIAIDSTVKDVLVSGFEISGFDSNILVVGGENTIVKENVLVNGNAYGFLADGSINTVFSGNSVTSKNELRGIAICTDNRQGAHVLNNEVSGYYVGLCIQTSSSEIAFNHVSNSCAGAFVDPGVDQAQFHHNEISALNPACIGAAPINSGLIIYGGTNAKVTSNTISGQHANGLAAGIVVVDAWEISPDLVAAGNQITDNILFDNDLDIFVNTTSTSNVVTHNQCSTPSALCS